VIFIYSSYFCSNSVVLEEYLGLWVFLVIVIFFKTYIIMCEVGINESLLFSFHANRVLGQQPAFIRDSFGENYFHSSMLNRRFDKTNRLIRERDT
jgi:hypothetical protein